MRRYLAVCGCGLSREYARRADAERKLDGHDCRAYRATHRRRCRRCGWSGVYRSAARADDCKRKHVCEKWIARAAARERAVAQQAAIDRTPKPCRHKEAEHRHGTNAAYVLDRCRCVPCSNAHSAAEMTRHRLKAYGRYDKYVDADQARAHVHALMGQGMGLKRIAAVSGVAHGTLWKLVYGKRRPDGTQQPSSRVTRSVHDRIVAVEVDLADGARVDPTGTRRRVQALVAIGWSQTAIAVRLGIRRANFGVMLGRPTVTRRTRDAVAAVYDDWSMQLPPTSTARERASAARARNHARVRGWAPPLAWDEAALDDPHAHPAGVATADIDANEVVDEAAIWRRMHGDKTIRLSPVESATVVGRLRDAGVSNAEIERRTGLNPYRHTTPRPDRTKEAAA